MTTRYARMPVILLLAAIAVAASSGPAIAGPGEAGRGRRPASAPARERPRADFAVLVWFRADDALGTFQYQTYDLRKGEYTEAVNAWIMDVREKYPHYVVHVLPVFLDHEPGATEKLKVGSVIHRELLLAAARSGIVLGAPTRIGPGLYPSRRPAPGPSIWTEAPGAGGVKNINPVGPTMPFPYPYPRPHP